MYEAKSLTTSNQPEKSNHNQQKRCRCGCIKHLRIISKDCPVGIAMINSKKLDLGMGISQSKNSKAPEDAAEEEEGKCLATEAVGEDENQMRGHQQ